MEQTGYTHTDYLNGYLYFNLKTNDYEIETLGVVYCAGDREAAADGDGPAGECWANTTCSVGEADGESVVGAAAGIFAAVLVGVAVGMAVDDWGTGGVLTLGGVMGLASLADGADGAGIKFN